LRTLFRIARVEDTETLVVLYVIPRGELESAVSRLPDI
jgi:hypothetical protein